MRAPTTSRKPRQGGIPPPRARRGRSHCHAARPRPKTTTAGTQSRIRSPRRRDGAAVETELLTRSRPPLRRLLHLVGARCVQRLSYLGDELEEARLFPRRGRPRLWQVHGHDARDAPRPRRHDDDARGEGTASEIEWVTKITVEPVSAQMRSSSMLRRSRVISSSAPNGSSMSRSAGENENARAIDTRCCMPPESCHEVVLLEPGELDELEHVPDALRSLRAVPQHLEGQGDVLRHRAPVVEDGRLEHDSVVAVEPCLAGRLAVDGDVALGGLDDVADDAKQCRLSASRRSDQRDELAASDLQIDALERCHTTLAEDLREALIETTEPSALTQPLGRGARRASPRAGRRGRSRFRPGRRRDWSPRDSSARGRSTG